MLVARRYAHNQAQHYEHHMKFCPTSVPPAFSAAHWSLPVVRPFYNTTDLHTAWGLLIDAAEAGECSHSSTLVSSFGYDLVDVGLAYLCVCPLVFAWEMKLGVTHTSTPANLAHLFCDSDTCTPFADPTPHA